MCCLAACAHLSYAPALARGPRCQTQSEESPANSARGKDFRVDVQVVQPQRTAEGRLFYLLSYSYSFKGRRTVNIQGVGTVPATGKQRHLFTEEYLTFTDESGNVLTKVRLRPNKQPPEGGGLDLPNDSDFSQFVSDITQDQANFLPKALRTLNEWFASGYTIKQDGGVTSFVTVYREVEGLPSHLRGEIAVRMSYPFDPSGNQFYFRVYTSPRLYPKKSDDPAPQTAATLKVFEAFARRLLGDLKK